MPPSAEVDKAWRDLYEDCKGQVASCRLSPHLTPDLASRISREEAEKLPNVTVPVKTGGYMAGVDVFHQLHCLVSSLSIVQLLS
jgi:hypothetical protein